MDQANVSAYPPPERHGSAVASPTLPLPPPPDRESLDRFVEAVAATPNERRVEIRNAIGALNKRSRVADLLHEALLTLPCTDASRHNTLLSIIGELAEPASVEVLQRFVWLSDAELFGETASAAYDRGCDFTPIGLLQARAAEMLAWILKTEREDLLTSIIAEHPLQPVRIAAIDAYLFHRDDPDAASWLRDRARTGDAWAIDLPRRVREDVDSEEFDRLASEHEARHGHVPDLPQGHVPDPPQRSEEADDVS